jgi:BirA family biotin operon repressor/biotin-[acetyl-CoA-carboxylase] ligase
MYIKSTNSTNTLLKELIVHGNPPEFIYAGYQTAGRGQTGNGWESEADKNLLCSILLPPRKNLFELNVLVSVAVQRLLGEDFTIKWPNDIYWRDKKVAGILIENAIVGSEIKYSIAGIGLNVNQTEYVSNAPNPISLKQISGKEYDIHELMQNLYAGVQRALDEDVWTEYKAHLYRKEGFWPFVEREVSVAPTMNAAADTEGIFMARIADVMPTGEIVLEDQAGKERKYHYKQIRYVV